MLRESHEAAQRAAFALSKSVEIAVLTHGSADEVERHMDRVIAEVEQVLAGKDVNIAMLALWKILARHYALVR